MPLGSIPSVTSPHVCLLEYLQQHGGVSPKDALLQDLTRSVYRQVPHNEQQKIKIMFQKALDELQRAGNVWVNQEDRIFLRSKAWTAPPKKSGTTNSEHASAEFSSEISLDEPDWLPFDENNIFHNEGKIHEEQQQQHCVVDSDPVALPEIKILYPEIVPFTLQSERKDSVLDDTETAEMGRHAKIAANENGFAIPDPDIQEYPSSADTTASDTQSESSKEATVPFDPECTDIVGEINEDRIPWGLYGLRRRNGQTIIQNHEITFEETDPNAPDSPLKSHEPTIEAKPEPQSDGADGNQQFYYTEYSHVEETEFEDAEFEDTETSDSGDDAILMDYDTESE